MTNLSANFFRLIAAPALVGLLAALVTLYVINAFSSNPDSEITQPSSLSNGPASLFGFQSSGPISYASAVEAASPSVVNIYTTKLVENRVHPLFNDPSFRRFFGLENSPKRNRMESSLGSGVIISSDGYVVTNNHVIRDAVEIYVACKDGRESLAKVVGTDPETDLAVLKIDLEDVPAIQLASSADANVGDVVLAIGNPFGFGQTVTMGIISAKSRDLQLSTYEDFIQTDAAINPGNSGGALIDPQGRLIGVNTAIFSQSGGTTGIGFAIPTDLARSVLYDIIESGRVIRGWLGIRPNIMDREMSQQYGQPYRMSGVVIEAIYSKGPADQAKLKPGDVIIAINDLPIHDARTAMDYIAETQPGTRVKIKYVRGSEGLTTSVTVGERPGVQ